MVKASLTIGRRKTALNLPDNPSLQAYFTDMVQALADKMRFDAQVLAYFEEFQNNPAKFALWEQDRENDRLERQMDEASRLLHDALNSPEIS